jgi:aryl-alcohol dehydrogenase-like predicted oxidoreductase
MEKRNLGKSGPPVSVISFGTWSMGGSSWQYGWPDQDDAEAIACLHAALDSGINLIDTAPAYGLGHAESLIGKALAGRRHEAIIATKAGLVWNDKGEVTTDVTYDNILREAEHSLRRLKTDYIDLYLVHWPDWHGKTPIEETMEALHRLLREGKVRQVGACNYSKDQIIQSMSLVPLAVAQNDYSMLQTQPEKDLIPYCKDVGMGVMAYSPLASGILSGRYDGNNTFKEDDWRSRDNRFTGEEFRRRVTVAKKLNTLANQAGMTLAELALSYILSEPGVASAVLGIRKREHIERILHMPDHRLTVDIRKQAIRIISE